MKTITRIEAKNRNLTALTIPYNIPDQYWMIDNIINDLNKDNIEHELVNVGMYKVEIWRTGFKYDERYDRILRQKERNEKRTHR